MVCKNVSLRERERERERDQERGVERETRDPTPAREVIIMVAERSVEEE
jgi:hypothetical protein